MELGIDICHWDEIDYQKLAACGVRFAFVKATQGNYSVDKMMTKHVMGCKEAGIITAVYHWCDPTRPAIPQAEYFLKAIAPLGVDGVALDVEQQWADWAEWSKRKITKVLTPSQISENAREIAEYVTQKFIQPVIYTSGYFTAEYTPNIATWAKKYPLWLAHYPYKSGLQPTTWQQLHDNWKGMQTWSNGSPRVPPLESPKLPPGCTGWKFWQISGDRHKPEGCQSVIDIDLFNGDYQQLLSFFHFPVAEPAVKPIAEAALIKPPTDHEILLSLVTEARKRGWQV